MPPNLGPDEPEEVSNLGDEDLRLLEVGELAASIQLVPAAQVRVGPGGPVAHDTHSSFVVLSSRLRSP